MSETNQALVVISSSVPTVLAADKDDILGTLAREIAAHKPDATTPGGRKAIASLANKVASSKMDLIRLGKGLTEAWRKSTKAVNEECNIIEARMDALKVQVRAPLTAYEEREKNRVAAHEEALLQLQALAAVESVDCTVEHIDSLLVQASTLVTTRTWEEFQDRASELFAAVNDALNDLRDKTIRVEAEKAEADRLHAELQERVKLEAIRDQEAREARLQAEAAEKARTEAEAAAERRYAAELEEQRQRADAAHQAELARVQAEERAKAKAALDEKIKQERIDAEQRAAQRAQEARDAALIAERERMAEGQRAAELAAKQREANVAHQRKVNREAMAEIVKIIDRHFTADTPLIPASCGMAIVTAIAKREIPHCKIEY